LELKSIVLPILVIIPVYNPRDSPKAKKDDLSEFVGETEDQFKTVKSETALYRDKNDLEWSNLNDVREEEATEYQDYKDKDSEWKKMMQSTFEDEQAVTSKERSMMMESIDQLVDDKNEDSVNSIAEIFNHITEVADFNVMNIRTKTDIDFTADQEQDGMIIPAESIHQYTLSVKMNGVEVYEGEDYTTTYLNERVVGISMERSLNGIYKDGGRLSISGRVGELKQYEFNLTSPFAGQGKFVRPIEGENDYASAIGDFRSKEVATLDPLVDPNSEG
jgi:hypothetical protein